MRQSSTWPSRLTVALFGLLHCSVTIAIVRVMIKPKSSDSKIFCTVLRSYLFFSHLPSWWSLMYLEAWLSSPEFQRDQFLPRRSRNSADFMKFLLIQRISWASSCLMLMTSRIQYPCGKNIFHEHCVTLDRNMILTLSCKTLVGQSILILIFICFFSPINVYWVQKSEVTLLLF